MIVFPSIRYVKNAGTVALCSVCMWPFSPFVPTSHLRASLCVSYRETCAAIACMDAAATHYLGSRSQGSWRGEQHPTPPRPLPQPDTLFSTPCRGRTWSRRSTEAPRVDLICRHFSLVTMCPTKFTLTQDELNFSGIFVSFLQFLNQLCMNLIQ